MFNEIASNFTWLTNDFFFTENLSKFNFISKYA